MRQFKVNSVTEALSWIEMDAIVDVLCDCSSDRQGVSLRTALLSQKIPFLYWSRPVKRRLDGSILRYLWENLCWR